MKDGVEMDTSSAEEQTEQLEMANKDSQLCNEQCTGK